MVNNLKIIPINNIQTNQETIKVITTMNSDNLNNLEQKSSLGNDLLYGDLGEEILFGDDQNYQNIDTKKDNLLQSRDSTPAIPETLDQDILTKGRDNLVVNTFDEEINALNDLTAIIEQIDVNENNFGIDFSGIELAPKFEFNPVTGTLSYNGIDLLMINSDGSFEIMANSGLF